MNAEDFDCDRCRAQHTAYCDEDRKIPGSLGPAPYPRWSRVPRDILDGLGEPEGLRTCPLTRRPAWWPDLWQLHVHWRQGILLRAGGLDDQPAPYPLLMSAIAGAINQAEAAKLKKGGQ